MHEHVEGVKSDMHDYEAHLRAVEEDLEYYRTKRFEPRIFYLTRKGVISLYDILKAHFFLRSKSEPTKVPEKSQKGTVARIIELEDGLDDYVKGISLVASGSIKGLNMVIEDNRKERGDYDEFFRFAKKEHPGSLEERIERLAQDVQDYQMLLDAFTYALIQRGLVDEGELKKKREALSVPSVWNGGIIVAKAWVDPTFKAELLEKGREALREIGIHQGRLGKLGVVENTDSVHNVVVCTLCSCYPYDLLGDTPWWYKHDIYKKRIIENPRGTLEEMFGLKISPEMELRVHDSTSDVRYMILPRRPKDTEGMTEEELAQLVTVDSLIGAGEPLNPPRQDAKGDEVQPTPRARDE